MLDTRAQAIDTPLAFGVVDHMWARQKQGTMDQKHELDSSSQVAVATVDCSFRIPDSVASAEGDIVLPLPAALQELRSLHLQIHRLVRHSVSSFFQAQMQQELKHDLVGLHCNLVELAARSLVEATPLIGIVCSPRDLTDRQCRYCR